MRFLVLGVAAFLLWGCGDAGVPEPERPSAFEAEPPPLPAADDSTVPAELVDWVDAALEGETGRPSGLASSGAQPSDNAECEPVIEAATSALSGHIDWQSVPWEAADREARRHHDFPCVIDMQTVAALARSGQSDYQGALDHYAKSRFLAARVGDVERYAKAEIGMGTARFQLGRYAEAVPEIMRALEFMPPTDELTWHRASALVYLGRALGHLGRTEDAVEQLSASIELRETLEIRTPHAAGYGGYLFPALQATGRVLLDAGRLEEAEAYFRRADAVASYSGAARANASLSMAELRWKQGDPELALQLLERARRQLAESHSSRLDLLTNLDFVEASARNETGDLAGALSIAERLVARLEAHRAFSGTELTMPFFTLRTRYSNLRVRLLLQAGQLEQAFEAAESLRARGLLDHIMWPPALLLESASKADSAQVGRLRDELSRLASEGTAEDRLLAIRDALIQAESRIRRNASAMAAQPSSFEEARNLLGPEDLLLSFWPTGEGVALWITTGRDGSLRFVQLPKLEVLSRSIRALHRFTRGPRVGDARRETKVLSRLLLDPVAQELETTRHVVIAAEGVLGSIPFSSLYRADGRRLVQTHSVSSIHSLSVLQAIRDRQKAASARPQRAFAGVAGPVYLPSSHSRPTLPASTAAAKTIRQFFDSSPGGSSLGDSLLLEGPEATRELVLDGALASSRWVHIGAHVELHASLPDLSAIRLSENGPGGAAAGALYLRDLRRLRLHADIVTLAGCSSSGELRRGAEGPMAFPRAFLHVGADSVVASLWPIHDQPTAEFMVEFYRLLLREQVGPGEALRRAQLSLAEGRWPRVRDWAGFVLLGEWTDGRSGDEKNRLLNHSLDAVSTEVKPRSNAAEGGWTQTGNR